MTNGNNLVPLGHVVVGRCSICNGNVTVPVVWGGIQEPTPTCTMCRAVKKSEDRRPWIEMEPPDKLFKDIF